MDYANTLKLASVYCLREAARKVQSHLYRRSEEIHPCLFFTAHPCHTPLICAKFTKSLCHIYKNVNCALSITDYFLTLRQINQTFKYYNYGRRFEETTGEAQRRAT
jgi:hypothetical protein